MPNGHSGSFLIETAALKRLLRAAPDTAPIGKLAGGSSDPGLRLVNATEVLRLVEESPTTALLSKNRIIRSTSFTSEMSRPWFGCPSNQIRPYSLRSLYSSRNGSWNIPDEWVLSRRYAVHLRNAMQRTDARRERRPVRS
jgi:hypothetical protein